MSFDSAAFREGVRDQLLPLFDGGLFAYKAPPRVDTFPYGVIRWTITPNTAALTGDAHVTWRSAMLQVDIYERPEAEDGSLLIAVEEAINGINIAGAFLRWGLSESPGMVGDDELIYSYVSATYQIPLSGALTV